MFFITIHDALGNRIDDDSDHPLTEEQLDGILANYDRIEIAGWFGQPFYTDGEQIISYSAVA